MITKNQEPSEYYWEKSISFLGSTGHRCGATWLYIPWINLSDRQFNKQLDKKETTKIDVWNQPSLRLQ